MGHTASRYLNSSHDVYPLHNIQAFNKPSSEQDCSKAHEPYALHKKIRSKECLLSGKISAMEKKFKRLLNDNELFTDTC